MSFYQPTTGSLGTAGGTPLNQQPISRTELVRMATLPAACVIQNRPNYVMINNTGSYAFLYTTSGSSGGRSDYIAAENALQETWITGSIVVPVNHHLISPGTSGSSFVVNPIKLDINPVAWRRTDGTITGTTGDVTFVFNAKSIASKKG